MITKSLCNLLLKDAPFEFTDVFMRAFELLKKNLVSTIIIVSSDWFLPFELMCDASNVTIGIMLRQEKNGKLHVIFFAIRILNEAQMNYATTEKELLKVVFAFDKF